MNQSPLISVSYISRATQDMGVLALMRTLKIEEVAERGFPAWSMRFFLAKEIIAKAPNLTGILDGLPEHDVELLRLMRSAAE